MVQPVSPGQLPCSTSARSGLSRHRRSPPCGPIGASGLSLPGRLSTWPDATRKAYATQWTAFVSWADDAGVPWLPAAPVDVAEFLAALVGRRVGLATVRHLGSVLSPGLRPAVRRPVARTAFSAFNGPFRGASLCPGLLGCRDFPTPQPR